MLLIILTACGIPNPIPDNGFYNDNVIDNISEMQDEKSLDELIIGCWSRISMDLFDVNHNHISDSFAAAIESGLFSEESLRYPIKFNEDGTQTFLFTGNTASWEIKEGYLWSSDGPNTHLWIYKLEFDGDYKTLTGLPEPDGGYDVSVYIRVSCE